MQITKKRIKQLLLLMTTCFFIGVTLTSCEKDIYNLEETAPKQGIKISEKSLKELNQIPGFVDAFRKVQTKQLELKNNTARTALEDLYDFTIVTDKVKVMERPDSTKSYTFFIERETKSFTYFENLVIQIDKTGDLDAIIMKYIPTGPIVAAYHDSFVFEGEKEFTPLVTSGRIFLLDNGCVVITWASCTDLVDGHQAGDECNDPSHLHYHSMIICPQFASGGDGNVPNGPTSGGANPDNGIMSTPVNFTVGQLVHKKYIKNLTTTNPILGSCYAAASQEFKDNLAAFFGALDINDETVTETSIKAFADQAIMAVCGGAQVDFPNRVILDPTFLNNPKAMCLYNKLKQSPKFKEMFLDMFQENTKPNVTIKIADLPGTRVGETECDINNRFNNTIKIDEDYLNNGNNLEVVKTIIHESIHAFLNIKLSDSTIGMSIPNLNNLETNDCINQYYNGFNSSQSQHNFIYNFMLPTLQTILSEVKDTLISPENNLNIENDITILQPLNTNPVTFSGSIPWNWSNYYKYLSLKGLEACEFFKTEIANLTNGLNIVNPVEYYLYSQYNINANNDIDNDCNN